MSPTAPAPLRPATLAWIGLLLVGLGVGLYVLLLGVTPVRTSGLPAFVGSVGGVLLALRALRRSRSVAVLLPATLAGALALAFAWLFFLVAPLPPPGRFATLVRAPEVNVPSVAGTEGLSLAQLAERGPVWLVFFRGHW